MVKQTSNEQKKKGYIIKLQVPKWLLDCILVSVSVKRAENVLK